MNVPNTIKNIMIRCVYVNMNKDTLISITVAGGTLIIAILIGNTLIGASSIVKMNDQMCYACWKMNWTGDINGEVSYSCEWARNQTFQSWCNENAPLFANFSDCSNPNTDYPYMLQPLALVLVFMIIIGLILAWFNHKEKPSNSLNNYQ
jgi:hypothetical protein